MDGLICLTTYLGIELTLGFSLTPHIKTITGKATRAINILHRNMNKAPTPPWNKESGVPVCSKTSSGICPYSLGHISQERYRRSGKGVEKSGTLYNFNLITEMTVLQQYWKSWNGQHSRNVDLLYQRCQSSIRLLMGRLLWTFQHLWLKSPMVNSIIVKLSTSG